MSSWEQFLIDFLVQVFLPHFCRHTVLIADLALVGVILFARVGKGFGAPQLFWHETWSKQALAGFSVVVMTGQILFVAHLLDVGVLPRGSKAWERHLPQALKIGDASSIAGYLFGCAFWLVVSGILLAAVMWGIKGLSRAIHPKPPPDPVIEGPCAAPRPWTFPWPPGVQPWPMALGALAGLVLAVLLLFAAAGLLEVLTTRFHQTGEARYHVLGAMAFFFFLVLYLVPACYPTLNVATPASALCTLLGLLAAVTGFIEKWSPAKFPIAPFPTSLILLLLVLLWIGGLPRYKLRFDGFDPMYKKRKHAAWPPPPSNAATGFQPWTTHRDKPGPMVFVCLSGGGIRSSVWAAAVLAELEKKLPDFPYHIQLIAGASGGMVGASHYVETLVEPGVGRENWHHNVESTKLVADLAKDGLSETIKALIFRDLPLSFLPIPQPFDRGRVLERAWTANLGKSKTFGELLEGEQKGWRPSLVFSPTVVEDGRRLLVSNLDLNFMTEAKGNYLGMGKRVFYSQSALEFSQVFPGILPGFSIRTAARMSASFPYVTPAGALPTMPRRRVVDAGYFDNYGVSVAGNWIEDCIADPQKREWLKRNATRILILQIRDGVEDLSRPPATWPPMISSALTRGLEEVTAPPVAMLAARESVPLFRNDEKLEWLSKIINSQDDFGPDFFTTFRIDFTGDASLSWYLPCAEADAIKKCAQQVAESPEVKELEKWWTKEAPPTLKNAFAEPRHRHYGD